MDKKVAIMQPYFFPYIGYFQLINSVDEFVIYDNIQYTKRGFINRNRILCNGRDRIITLPIKKDSDFLDVSDRQLSISWEKDRQKILNLILSSYRKAKYFDSAYSIIEKCIMYEDSNLFKFIYNSVNNLCKYLGVETKIIISSTVDMNHSLRSQNKVIEICKAQKASVYINAIGGLELYSKEIFHSHNLKLNFIKTGDVRYEQFDNVFVPWLSIIDLMMFNSKEQLKEHLNNYTLV